MNEKSNIEFVEDWIYQRQRQQLLIVPELCAPKKNKHSNTPVLNPNETPEWRWNCQQKPRPSSIPWAECRTRRPATHYKISNVCLPTQPQASLKVCSNKKEYLFFSDVASQRCLDVVWDPLHEVGRIFVLHVQHLFIDLEVFEGR